MVACGEEEQRYGCPLSGRVNTDLDPGRQHPKSSVLKGALRRSVPGSGFQGGTDDIFVESDRCEFESVAMRLEHFAFFSMSFHKMTSKSRGCVRIENSPGRMWGNGKLRHEENAIQNCWPCGKVWPLVV